MRRGLSDKAIQNIFIWPTLVLLIAFNVFPLFYSLYLSFTDYRANAGVAPGWIGLENFHRVLQREEMWETFSVTGQYVVFSVLLQLILGFALAMLIKEKFFGSGIVTTLILVPMMLSPSGSWPILETHVQPRLWICELHPSIKRPHHDRMVRGADRR